MKNTSKTPLLILLLILVGFTYLYVSNNYEGFHTHGTGGIRGGSGGSGGGGRESGGGRYDGRGEHGRGHYNGVGRWGTNYGNGWVGSYIYPVSINCNCPDNYDFIDNNCVNRSYPFEVVAPFCYE